MKIEMRDGKVAKIPQEVARKVKEFARRCEVDEGAVVRMILALGATRLSQPEWRAPK